MLILPPVPPQSFFFFIYFLVQSPQWCISIDSGCFCRDWRPEKKIERNEMKWKQRQIEWKNKIEYVWTYYQKFTIEQLVASKTHLGIPVSPILWWTWNRSSSVPFLGKNCNFAFPFLNTSTTMPFPGLIPHAPLLLCHQ